MNLLQNIKMRMASYLAILMLLSCGGSGLKPISNSIKKIVVGTLREGDVSTPVSWGDNSVAFLSTSKNAGQVRAVKQVGDQIYIVGGLRNSNGLGLATYWVSGIPIRVGEENFESFANEMAIVNNEHIFVGYSKNVFGGTDAVLWEKSILVKLTDGLVDTMGEATGICVIDGISYISGWVTEKVEIAPNTYHFTPVAKLWRNGVPQNLSIPGLEEGVATAVASNGNDIYVSGYISASNGISNPYSAVYWKNGEMIVLPGGRFGAKALSIVLFSGQLYITGFVNEGGANIAALWVDGRLQLLSDGRDHATAQSIAFFGKDIVCAGTIGGKAVTWDNGMINYLPPVGSNSQAFGVLLMK